jgi:hypothetical protein
VAARMPVTVGVAAASRLVEAPVDQLKDLLLLWSDRDRDSCDCNYNPHHGGVCNGTFRCGQVAPASRSSSRAAWWRGVVDQRSRIAVKRTSAIDDVGRVRLGVNLPGPFSTSIGGRGGGSLAAGCAVCMVIGLVLAYGAYMLIAGGVLLLIAIPVLHRRARRVAEAEDAAREEYREWCEGPRRR